MVYAKNIIIGLLMGCTLMGYSEPFYTHPLSDNIRTLQVTIGGQSTITQPIVSWEQIEKQPLEISFDEMSHDTKRYCYTINHCDATWEEERIPTTDYIDGFTMGDITDYSMSHNTVQLYTHYAITFPNETMKVTLSGNYVMKILDSNNDYQEVAYVCFSVVEQQVQIEASVTSNTEKGYNSFYQQVDFTIVTPKGTYGDISRDYRVVVQQNGRRDNIVCFPKPTHITGNKLTYQRSKELVFEGGNEYRQIDIFSTYLYGKNVREVKFVEHSAYHAFVEPDQWTPQDPYLFRYDGEGIFHINAERVMDINTECEYMWVHFYIPRQEPFLDGRVYIGGNGWYNRVDSTTQMDYDFQLNAYYYTAYLKQGGYEYQYWFLPKGSNDITLQRTEGSYWQTTNQYTIYVYHHPLNTTYDALVGIYTTR